MKKNETKKFDQNAYIKAYMKNNYKDIKIHVKPEIFDKITTYCKDMDISRTEFLVKSALYIIDNNLLDEIK